MSPNVVLPAVEILCPFNCFRWSDQSCISYTCYILRHIQFAVLCTLSPGGYPWEFLVKVCRPVLQIMTLFHSLVPRGSLGAFPWLWRWSGKRPFSRATSKATEGKARLTISDQKNVILQTSFQTIGRNHVVITKIRTSVIEDF